MIWKLECQATSRFLTHLGKISRMSKTSFIQVEKKKGSGCSAPVKKQKVPSEWTWANWQWIAQMVSLGILCISKVGEEVVSKICGTNSDSTLWLGQGLVPIWSILEASWPSSLLTFLLFVVSIFIIMMIEWVLGSFSGQFFFHLRFARCNSFLFSTSLFKPSALRYLQLEMIGSCDLWAGS